MTINKQLLIGAVARGWCHEKNSHKEMDADIVNAIVNELECAFATLPATGKLVDLGITEELLIDQIHAQAKTMGKLLDRVIAAESKLNAFRSIEDKTLYDLIKSVEELEAEVHAAEEESDRAMQEYDRSMELCDNLRDALIEARNQLRHYKNKELMR